MENKIDIKPELLEVIKAKLYEQDILLEKICNSASSPEDIESNTSNHYSDYLRGVYFIKEWLTAHRYKLRPEDLVEIKASVTQQSNKLTHHEQFLERSLNRVIR